MITDYGASVLRKPRQRRRQYGLTRGAQHRWSDVTADSGSRDGMQLKLQQVWTLGTRIGGGGFGQVYAATSATGESAVAKLVPKAPGAERELLFVDLAGVRNVVPVIDSDATDDAWVIVMPRAEQSLRQHLDEVGGPLAVSDASA